MKCLNYKNITKTFLQIEINLACPCARTLSLMFLWLSMVFDITDDTLWVQWCRSVQTLIHRLVFTPYERLIPVIPVLMTRIISLSTSLTSLLHFHRRSVCQPQVLLSAYNALHSMHFQYLSKILILQIVQTPECGHWSNITYITNILQKWCRKNGFITVFLIKAKRPN